MLLNALLKRAPAVFYGAHLKAAAASHSSVAAAPKAGIS